MTHINYHLYSVISENHYVPKDLIIDRDINNVFKLDLFTNTNTLFTQNRYRQSERKLESNRTDSDDALPAN